MIAFYDDDWTDFSISINNVIFPKCIVSLPNNIDALLMSIEKTTNDEEGSVMVDDGTSVILSGVKFYIEFYACLNIVELYIIRCINSYTQYLVNAKDIQVSAIPFGVSSFSTSGTCWFKSLPEENDEIYYKVLQLIKPHLENTTGFNSVVDNAPFIPFTPKAQFFLNHNGETIIGVFGVNKYGRNCVGYYKDLVLLPECFEVIVANMHVKNAILLNTKTLTATSTDCLLSVDQHTIIVDTDGDVDFKKIDAIRQLLRVVENNLDLLDMFKRIINNYK